MLREIFINTFMFAMVMLIFNNNLYGKSCRICNSVQCLGQAKVIDQLLIDNGTKRYQCLKSVVNVLSRMGEHQKQLLGGIAVKVARE